MKTVKEAVIQFKAQWPEGATHLVSFGEFIEPTVVDKDRYACLNQPGCFYRTGVSQWQILCNREQFEAALWNGAPDWAVDIRVGSLGVLFWTNGRSRAEAFEGGYEVFGLPCENKIVATRPAISASTSINAPAPGPGWYDYDNCKPVSHPIPGLAVQVIGNHPEKCQVIRMHPLWSGTVILCWIEGVNTGQVFNTSLGNVRPLDWDKKRKPVVDAAIKLISTCPSKSAESLANALYNAGMLVTPAPHEDDEE